MHVSRSDDGYIEFIKLSASTETIVLYFVNNTLMIKYNNFAPMIAKARYEKRHSEVYHCFGEVRSSGKIVPLIYTPISNIPHD